MQLLDGHSKDVRTVAFSADGKLVSGGNDRTVRVWEFSTGECLATIKAKLVVYAVAVSPDEETIAYAGSQRNSGSVTNKVHFWSLSTRKAVGEWEFTGLPTPEVPPIPYFFPGINLPPELETGLHTDWSERGQAMAEMARQRMLEMTRPLSRSIWSLAFSADGKYLAAAGRVAGAGNIRNGGGGNWCEFANRKNHGKLPDDAFAVSFSPVGHTLAITRRGVVTIHTSPDQAERLQYPLQCDWANDIVFTRQGRVAIVAANSYLHVMQTEQSAKATKLKTGLRVVTALAVSPDGRSILAGGKPGSVELYDAETLEIRKRYDFGVGGVHDLAMAPDGMTFAVAGEKGLIRCDLEDG